MIYTIGHTQNYLRYYIEQGGLKKGGKCAEHGGGSVWKTFDEAKAHCSESYSVFGVEADWEKDTEPNEKVDWNNLLVNSKIVLLPEHLAILEKKRQEVSYQFK